MADDHAMVCAGLAALVAKDPQIEVVGQCRDGLAVLNQIAAVKPDVLVLDITMPGLNGLDVCREVRRRHPDTVILILTMHDEEQFIANALENGASGYLLKEAAADELASAIHRVAKGELYLGPGIPQSALRMVGRAAEDPYDLLTTRERQVLQLIAEGKTNRQVAEELDLAVKTVDTHRTRLMRKLNIHDQTSLVKFAIRKGVISLD
ncbi:MAG: response regulator [Phycisphaerae bacterium]